MAERKKSSGSSTKAQTRAELAETLQRAAELTALLENMDAQHAEEKPAAKKPAAKKPAAKKSTAQSGTAKKPAAKKPAAKKPATKKPATKAVAKDEPATEEKPETEEKPAVEEQPVAEAQPAVEEKPAAEEQPVVVEQPAAEAQPEVKEQPAPAEQPVATEETKKEEIAVTEEQPKEIANQDAQPAAEAPAPAAQPVAVKTKKTDAFMNKSSDFINNKGKFPLWIVANVLLLLSSIFLIARAFDIPNPYGGKSITGNLFTYYGNGPAIKAYWIGTAGEWTNGGYSMMGILMFFSFLVPLALIAKNIAFFVIKKDKNVHMLDAIVTFAFLIAYLGVVNMYGANMTWSHILSLIMSIILLAYTIFVILIENREGPFPFFSIANIVMIMLCMFLLTSNKIYAKPGWYAAAAAGASGGGGFAFVMLLFALAALVLLLVMQVKKLPGKIEYFCGFIVPAVAGVLALIAVISFAGGKPTGLSMGGGFVFGVILTILFAGADVAFALVPQLHKFYVKVTDRMPASSGAKPAPVVQPVAAQPQEATTEQQTQPATEQQPAAQPTDKLVCPACGQENAAGDVFCMKCGRKLK